MKYTLLILITLALAPKADAQVEGICLFNSGWHLCFEPDGSANGIYGELLESCIQLKAGTVDFSAMVAKINKAEPSATPEIGKFQISMEVKDQGVKPAFTLKDNTIIEKILASHEKQWTHCPPKKPEDPVEKTQPAPSKG